MHALEHGFNNAEYSGSEFNSKLTERYLADISTLHKALLRLESKYANKALEERKALEEQLRQLEVEIKTNPTATVRKEFEDMYNTLADEIYTLIERVETK